MADDKNTLHKRLYVATLSTDLVDHILATGGPELLDILATKGAESITRIVDPEGFATFLETEDAGYKYQKSEHTFAFGGISPALVAYAQKEGGPASLSKVIGNWGKQVVRATHADVLEAYCKARGIPYDGLAKELTKRATELINAKDLDSSALELLAREMPKERAGGQDDELLALADARITELEEDVDRLSGLYDTVRAQYAQTLAEVAGRPNPAALQTLLTNTIQALKKGGAVVKDTKDLDKLRGEYEQLKSLQSRTEASLSALKRDYGSLEVRERQAQDALRTAKETLDQERRRAGIEKESLQSRLQSAQEGRNRAEQDIHEQHALYTAASRQVEEAYRQVRLMEAQLVVLLHPETEVPPHLFKPVVCKEEQDLYLAIARDHFKQRRYDRLATTLTEGIEVCENNEKLVMYRREVVNDWYELGRKAQKKGDESDARAYYRRIIQFDPTYARAHLRLAQSYHVAGRNTHARPHYEQVLVLDPGCVEAQKGLSKL